MSLPPTDTPTPATPQDAAPQAGAPPFLHITVDQKGATVVTTNITVSQFIYGLLEDAKLLLHKKLNEPQLVKPATGLNGGLLKRMGRG